MAYQYYITKKFKSTSELSDFLNGTSVKSGTVAYDNTGSGSLTDATGGFGTDTYNGKKIILSGIDTELTVGSTTSDTIIVPSAETDLVNSTSYAYKIFDSIGIASTDIVELSQDHSNLWVLVYKTAIAGF